MSVTFLSCCVCSNVFINENMGVIPIPAAKKNTCLYMPVFCGSVKRPAAPVVYNLSLTTALSVRRREYAPLSMRFTVNDNASLSAAQDDMEKERRSSLP